ncbi:uncharacterized [Tachysurus ichikawai]
MIINLQCLRGHCYGSTALKLTDDDDGSLRTFEHLLRDFCAPLLQPFHFLHSSVARDKTLGIVRHKLNRGKGSNTPRPTFLKAAF